MPSWVSATHQAAGRSFSVVDRSWVDVEAGGVNRFSREVQDSGSGEVVRRFSQPEGHYGMPPYDWDDGQKWLEKQYGPVYGINSSPTVAGAVYASSGTATWTINAHSAATITTAPATARADHTHKEQDMAQRHEFTFPYTGSQIAAALDVKIARLDNKIAALEGLDLSALSAIYDVERNDDLGRKTERAVKEFKAKREALQLESTPYRQAAGKEFDLDLEDVQHFGLNQADVEPTKAKRTRRTKAQIEAEKAQELASA